MSIKTGLGAPVVPLVVLGLLTAVHIALAHHFHRPALELAIDAASAALVAIALHLHRTRGIRFIALLAQPDYNGKPQAPEWSYASSSYLTNTWAVSVITGAVLFGAAMFFGLSGTKDFHAQGRYPYAIWCGLVGAMLFVTHLRSRGIAKILVEPPAQWTAVTGAIAAKVDVVASFSRSSKFVESQSMSRGLHKDTREIESTDEVSVKFEVAAEGKTWKVDPEKATWASAGRVVPPDNTSAGNGYTLSFVEVLPADGQVLVVGQPTGDAFQSKTLDSLYLYPYAAGRDPRAELRSYRLWSLVMAALPFAAIALLVVACGSSPAAIDAPMRDDALPPPVDGPIYRTSISGCWRDATCPRVMAIAHGGAWDVETTPYDSNAAIADAYTDGNDGVKIEVRIAKDGVAVVAHSSPIEVFESTDCNGMMIEDMTAAEVMQCHRFPSTTETFQRLDDVLGYLRGRMVVQLCVKLASDFAATIALVDHLGAQDYAFIEIPVGDVAANVHATDDVYYLIDFESDLSMVDAMLARADPHLFMYEIDPTAPIGTLITDKLHPANVRAFTYDDSTTITVDQLVAHYAAGYDVVSSQSGPNSVAARMMINAGRGVTPP